jgi:PmbA protein
MSEQNTSTQSGETASETLLERARQAVELARAAGAADAWATASEQRHTSLALRDGKPETVSEATTRSVEIRLYVDGRYGVYSTTDLREPRLRDFIREAVPLTRKLQADPDRRITPPDLFPSPAGPDLQLLDGAVSRLESGQRLDWCRAMDAAAREEPRLISAGSRVEDGQVQTASASSNGFSGAYASTNVGLVSILSLRDAGAGGSASERRAEGMDFAVCLHLSDLPDARRIAEGALARARARLGSRQGPTIKTTLVVESRAANSLIKDLLAPATAANIQQGQSFWPALMERPAFSDKLSIVDDPLRPRGLESRPYDREGIAARRLTLIERGVPKAVYADAYYGAKARLPITTGQSSNQIVQPGTRGLAELVRAVGDGILVTGWAGGNADPTTGAFSQGLNGHLIRNGEIAEPVVGMIVTGSLPGLFASLVEVGNDPFPYDSLLTPSLVFENVQFSGA